MSGSKPEPGISGLGPGQSGLSSEDPKPVGLQPRRGSGPGNQGNGKQFDVSGVPQPTTDVITARNLPEDNGDVSPSNNPSPHDTGNNAAPALDDTKIPLSSRRSSTIGSTGSNMPLTNDASENVLEVEKSSASSPINAEDENPNVNELASLLAHPSPRDHGLPLSAPDERERPDDPTAPIGHSPSHSNDNPKDEGLKENISSETAGNATNSPDDSGTFPNDIGIPANTQLGSSRPELDERKTEPVNETFELVPEVPEPAVETPNLAVEALGPLVEIPELAVRTGSAIKLLYETPERETSAIVMPVSNSLTTIGYENSKETDTLALPSGLEGGGMPIDETGASRGGLVLPNHPESVDPPSQERSPSNKIQPSNNDIPGLCMDDMEMSTPDEPVIGAEVTGDSLPLCDELMGKGPDRPVERILSVENDVMAPPDDNDSLDGESPVNGDNPVAVGPSRPKSEDVGGGRDSSSGLVKEKSCPETLLPGQDPTKAVNFPNTYRELDHANDERTYIRPGGTEAVAQAPGTHHDEENPRPESLVSPQTTSTLDGQSPSSSALVQDICPMGSFGTDVTASLGIVGKRVQDVQATENFGVSGSTTSCTTAQNPRDETDPGLQTFFTPNTLGSFFEAFQSTPETLNADKAKSLDFGSAPSSTALPEETCLPSEVIGSHITDATSIPAFEEFRKGVSDINSALPFEEPTTLLIPHSAGKAEETAASFPEDSVQQPERHSKGDRDHEILSDGLGLPGSQVPGQLPAGSHLSQDSAAAGELSEATSVTKDVASSQNTRGNTQNIRNTGSPDLKVSLGNAQLSGIKAPVPDDSSKTILVFSFNDLALQPKTKAAALREVPLWVSTATNGPGNNGFFTANVLGVHYSWPSRASKNDIAGVNDTKGPASDRDLFSAVSPQSDISCSYDPLTDSFTPDADPTESAMTSAFPTLDVQISKPNTPRLTGQHTWSNPEYVNIANLNDLRSNIEADDVYKSISSDTIGCDSLLTKNESRPFKPAELTPKNAADRNFNNEPGECQSVKDHEGVGESEKRPGLKSVPTKVAQGAMRGDSTTVLSIKATERLETSPDVPMSREELLGLRSGQESNIFAPQIRYGLPSVAAQQKTEGQPGSLKAAASKVEASSKGLRLSTITGPNRAKKRETCTCRHKVFKSDIQHPTQPLPAVELMSGTRPGPREFAAARQALKPQEATRSTLRTRDEAYGSKWLEVKQSIVESPKGGLPKEIALSSGHETLGGSASQQKEADDQVERRGPIATMFSYVTSFVRWNPPKSPKTQSKAKDIKSNEAMGKRANGSFGTAEKTCHAALTEKWNFLDSRNEYREIKASWDVIRITANKNRTKPVGASKKVNKATLDTLGADPVPNGPVERVDPSTTKVVKPKPKEYSQSTNTKTSDTRVPLGGITFKLTPPGTWSEAPHKPKGTLSKPGGNSVVESCPPSGSRGESSSTRSKAEDIQVAATSYCRKMLEETEDEGTLPGSSPGGTVFANGVPLIHSPIINSLFRSWLDTQDIPSFESNTASHKVGPTPITGIRLFEGYHGYSAATPRSRSGRVNENARSLKPERSHIFEAASFRQIGVSTRELQGACFVEMSPKMQAKQTDIDITFASTPGHSMGCTDKECQGEIGLAQPISSTRLLEQEIMEKRQGCTIHDEREDFAQQFMDDSDGISSIRFLQLEHLIEEFCVEHFSRLPTCLQLDGSALHNQSSFPPEFLCTTKLGQRLRIAAVQYIICHYLTKYIFTSTVPNFCFNMDAVSEELMRMDPMKQVLWRILTVEALTGLPQYEVATAKLRQKTVNEISLSIMQLSGSSAATLTAALHNLVSIAQQVWEPTHKSKYETIAEVEIENGMRNFAPDPADSTLNRGAGIEYYRPNRPVLCLFPAIYKIVDGRDELVVPGRALFADICHSAQSEFQSKLHPSGSEHKPGLHAGYTRPTHLQPHHPCSVAGFCSSFGPQPPLAEGRSARRASSADVWRGSHSRCLHPHDLEDNMIGLWDVHYLLKEFEEENSYHGSGSRDYNRRRSMGHELLTHRRSSYGGWRETFAC